MRVQVLEPRLEAQHLHLHLVQWVVLGAHCQLTGRFNNGLNIDTLFRIK